MRINTKTTVEYLLKTGLEVEILNYFQKFLKLDEEVLKVKESDSRYQETEQKLNRASIAIDEALEQIEDENLKQKIKQLHMQYSDYFTDCEANNGDLAFARGFAVGVLLKSMNIDINMAS